MVLKRVGERIVDVLVNGNQQASYTQTAERADYDVQVSANSTTFVTAFTGTANVESYGEIQPIASEDFASWQSSAQEAFEDSDRKPDEIRVLAEANDEANDTVRVTLTTGDLTYPIDQESTGTQDSGWVAFPSSGIRDLVMENSNGSTINLHYQIQFRYTVAPGYSIDGVTKS